MNRAAQAYAQASRQSATPRETEITLFRQTNETLEGARSEGDRIRALGRNHDMWSALVKDLAIEGNGLPESLRTQLMDLGIWSMRYSTIAILHKLPVEPLVNVNRNVCEGLQAQAS